MTKLVVKCLVIGLLANICVAQERAPSVQPVQLSVEGLETQAVIQGQTLVIQAPTAVTPIAVETIPVPVAPGSAAAVPVIPGSVPVPSPEAGPGIGRRGSKVRMVPTLPKEFEARDKNGDGQIGMYEWERSKYAEFMKLDKNGDGFLTPQELLGKSAVLGAKSRQEALPNPGSLVSYGQKVGESFDFTVTGQTSGSVYGTGTYTTDSTLAAVAVHAGVLKEGQTGVVHVTIVAPPAQFAASSANGVTSAAWGSYPAAYTVR